MNEQEYVIVADNLVKKYGDKVVVNDLSFKIKRGQMLGLLGVNGAGKTTTFRMLLNIIAPNSGSVSFLGDNVDFHNSDKIGYLKEERSLLLKYTVLEQVVFFALLKGMKESDIVNRLDYWLEYFNVVEYKNKKIKELSKGNQQKIQFITAIIHQPEFLILDEPFSGLDPINIDLFKNAMLELSASGTSIIFSSHRMDHVEFFCEDIIILYNGITVIKDSITNLKENYRYKKVLIKGDVDLDLIKAIDDVQGVEVINDVIHVKVGDSKTIDDIFNVVKQGQYLKQFNLEYPSLEEIFKNTISEEISYENSNINQTVIEK